MKLEEKARFLTGKGMRTMEYPEYNTGYVECSDGPNGVRFIGKDHPIEGGDVAFPTGSAEAATWNPNLIRKMGNHLALNCTARGISMILAPGVNIQSRPLCGRNYEYFSEDPLLAGEIGAAYINGVQEYGVGTSLKHFAMNHQENYRGVINAEVAERPLREIYLAVFEHIIKKSNPTTVMCAYNKINGHFASENKKLITDILRGEWGYGGMMISDWGAVHDVANALKAGMDLIMPERKTIVEDVMKALDDGRITETDVDIAVARIQKFIHDVENLPKPDIKFDRAKAHEVATEVEREAIVLLKNEDNILPIDTKKYKKIGVLGYYAEEPNVYTNLESSGNVHLDPNVVDKPLEWIKKFAEENGAEIMYEPLYSYYDGSFKFPELIKIQELAKECDMLIFFAGYPPYWEIEGDDRESINLPVYMIRLAEECSRFCKDTVVVTQTGAQYAPIMRQTAPKGLVQMWYGGEGAGKAIAEVLFGKTNPSGKLPMTFMTEENKDLKVEWDGRYIDYSDGLFVGYRYYDKHPDKIWFPFGYGLSYTSFDYSDLKLETEDNLTAKVSFKITNTGKVAGKEVCQLYVAPLEASVIRPIKELKGFDKIFLEPGETKEVNMFLDERAFSYYNTNENDWHEESGIYQIQVGASSRDIRLRGNVNIINQNDYTINRHRWSETGRSELVGGNE